MRQETKSRLKKAWILTWTWGSKRGKKHRKNPGILREKTWKFEKKTSSQTMFFLIAFFNGFWDGLGRVLESFWERFGSIWRALGHFEPIFGVHFWTIFLLIWLPRLLGAKNIEKKGFRRGFREVLRGFWRAFGRGLEAFGAHSYAIEASSCISNFNQETELIFNFKCVDRWRPIHKKGLHVWRKSLQ